MKKLITVLLVAMVLMMVGCGSSENGKKRSKNKSSEDEFSQDIKVNNNSSNSNKKEEKSLTPGIYDLAFDRLVVSWDELIESGQITFESTNGFKFISSSDIELFKEDTKCEYRLVFPDNFFSIGYINNYYNLKEVVTQGNLQVIDGYAFKGCCELEKIIIADNTSQLQSGAFSGTAITEIVLPENLGSFPSDIFEDCKYLKKIDFSKVTNILDFSQYKYIGWDAVEEIILSETVPRSSQTIGGACPNLKRVVLPESLRGTYADDYYGANIQIVYR